jgi:hypothetical protein
VTVVAGDAAGGKAANLNAAVRQAHNELLVFADTAQRFQADAIPALVAEFGIHAWSGVRHARPAGL